MSRPKGRPKSEDSIRKSVAAAFPTTNPEIAEQSQQSEELSEPSQPSRPTIINLKGTQEQVDWLESVHRKTHIAKTVIMRLALIEWAERNGFPPFPTSEGIE